MITRRSSTRYPDRIAHSPRWRIPQGPRYSTLWLQFASTIRRARKASAITHAKALPGRRGDRAGCPAQARVRRGEGVIRDEYRARSPMGRPRAPGHQPRKRLRRPSSAAAGRRRRQGRPARHRCGCRRRASCMCVRLHACDASDTSGRAGVPDSRLRRRPPARSGSRMPAAQRQRQPAGTRARRQPPRRCDGGRTAWNRISLARRSSVSLEDKL